jgi:hypothetical protein
MQIVFFDILLFTKCMISIQLRSCGKAEPEQQSGQAEAEQQKMRIATMGGARRKTMDKALQSGLLSFAQTCMRIMVTS